MFQLSKKEFEDWRSQFVTSNSGDKMGLRYRPYVFTQEGVAMLSSVLRSKRAIQVKSFQQRIEDLSYSYIMKRVSMNRMQDAERST